MKVLLVGDSIIQGSFSTITHNICNKLVNKCDLVVYGTGYDGRVKHPYKYYIYPAKSGDDIYNFDYFNKVVKDERPDVIIIFNYDYIVKKFLNSIKDIEIGRRILILPISLFPISVGNMLSFSSLESHVSSVLTYTDFAKSKILDINPNLKITSICGGVNHHIFYSVKDAKKELGLQNIFVVGNVSSNTYINRLDLFLKGFSIFAKNKSDVRCLIHTTSIDYTYNIKWMANNLGISNKLILSKNNLEFDKLNMLYNLLDLSVNTCLGSDLKLTLLESAACRVPILCPKQENLIDIWGDVATYIKLSKYTETVPNTEFEGEVIDLDDFVECLEKFYSDRSYTSSMGEAAFNYSNSERFDWGVVSNKVYSAITDAYQDKVNVLDTVRIN